MSNTPGISDLYSTAKVYESFILIISSFAKLYNQNTSAFSFIVNYQSVFSSAAVVVLSPSAVVSSAFAAAFETSSSTLSIAF